MRQIRLQVDMELCQDHAQCCYVAPQAFELDPDGHLIEPAGTQSIDLLDALEDAVDACPVQAISLAVIDE